MVGGIVLAVAVICDCLVLGLWLQSFKLGRQAAWRPGAFEVVSSGLVALYWQLLCAVIARNLGSGTGLDFGREAVLRLVGGAIQAVVVINDWVLPTSLPTFLNGVLSLVCIWLFLRFLLVCLRSLSDLEPWTSTWRVIPVANRA